MSRYRTSFQIVVVGLLGVVVTACGSGDSSSDTSDPLAPDEARCGVLQAGGSFTEIDCTEPHDGEFAGSVEGPGEVPEPIEIEGSDSEVYTDLDLVRSCAEPVSDLIGGPLEAFGIDVAYVTESDPGEDYEDSVECWAWSRAEGALSRSIAEAGLAHALGDNATAASLAPGDCFRFADPDGDSYDIVTLTECDSSDSEIEQVLGTVELDGDYPGDDAVSDEAGAGCNDLAETEGVNLDVVGFTYPTQRSWEALGQTTAICSFIGGGDSGEDAASDGYCLTVPDGSLQGERTDCGEPHNAEFVGQGEPPAGALPKTQVAIDIVIAEICRPVAAAAIGIAVLPPFLRTGNPPAAAPGVTLSEPFDCFIKVKPDDALTGSLIGADPVDVLGDYVVVADVEPGDCFLLVDGNFDLATPTDCSDNDALMSIGSFQADADGDFPGEDALKDIRNRVCAAMLNDSGLDVDPTTLSGVIPGETEWSYADVRTITCDAAPA